MGARFLVAKELASGSDSAATRIRSLDPPYLFSSFGGYTGDVTLEHSPDKGTTWISLGTMSDASDIEIQHPLERVRVSGDHSAGEASVVMIEMIRSVAKAG